MSRPPVLEEPRGGGVRASAAPGRGQASRCVTVDSWIVGGSNPSRMADTSGRAPGSGSEGGHLRDGRREGRVKDVACADARCAWKEPRGCARAANDRV